MSAASPLRYCYGRTSTPINVVMVDQPTMVCCFQIQPVETISLLADMQSQVGRKQVPVFFFDAAPAAVDPLGERFFLPVPTQTGSRQGSRVWAVLVEVVTAGAFSLAAHHLHQQSRCPVAHTAREVLLPRNVIQLLAHHIRAVRQQPVGQSTMQCLTVLRQPAMLLSDHRGAPFGGAGTLLPVAAASLMRAVGVKAARRARPVLTVHVPLPAA